MKFDSFAGGAGRGRALFAQRLTAKALFSLSTVNEARATVHVTYRRLQIDV